MQQDRCAVSLSRKKGITIVTFQAQDPVSLRAALDSTVKLLIVYNNISNLTHGNTDKRASGKIQANPGS